MNLKALLIVASLGLSAGLVSCATETPAPIVPSVKPAATDTKDKAATPKPDAMKPDATAKPDAMKTDSTKDKTGDAMKPSATAKPDAMKPDAAKPDAMKPDAAATKKPQ